MQSKNTLTPSSIVQSLVVGALTWLAATPAYAHHAMDGQTPQTFAQGFLSGLAHPVIGADHFAFLVVAALLAMAAKGSARFLIPLAFVVTTVGGTAIHLAGSNLPMSEMIVAATVITGAILALVKRDASALAISGLFAFAGVFHGYAYGESIVGAENTPLVAYLVGFSIIQYALIAGGIVGLEKLAQKSATAQVMAHRIGGGMALLTGSAFLVMAA